MFPKLTLEVGFTTDPSVPIASTAWTDITPYLLDADWDKGGRQYELDRAEAGTMSVRLLNSDRRFEPEYGGYLANYTRNGTFEVDTSFWSTFVASGTVAIARNATDAAEGGVAAGEITATPASGSASIAYLNNYASDGVPVTTGQSVFLRASVKRVSGAAITSFILVARVFDSAGALINQVTVATQASPVVGTWYELTGTYVAVPGDGWVTVQVQANASNALHVWRVDRVQNLPTTTPLGASPIYVNGQTNTPPYRWAGTAQLSQSYAGVPPYYPNVVPLRRIRLRIGENLCPNGSFESSLWTNNVGPGTGVSLDAANRLIGSQSMKLAATGATTGRSITVAGLTPGATYTLSGYIYVSAYTAGQVNFDVFEAAVIDTGGIILSATNSGFVRYSETFVYPGGGSGTVEVRFFGNVTPTFTAYLDGVQIVAGSVVQPYVDQVRSVFTGYVESWPPTYQQRNSTVAISCVDGFEPLAQAEIYGGPNKILNPSFETDASQWALVGGGTLARDTTQKAAGVASGKITAHASTTPTEYRPTITGVSGSTYYAASARVYIPSGLGITAGNVTVGLGVTGGSEVSVPAAALFDQWQTLLVPVLFTGGGEQGIFGNTVPGNSVKYRLYANRKYASKFTLDRSGVVTDLRVDIGRNYEDFGPPPGQLITGFIYSDSAGSPNALLGQSAEVTQDSWNNHQWLDLVFDPGIVLAAGTYWLGFIAGVTDSGSFYYFDTSGGSYAENADSYADGPSAGFGTPTTYARTLAVYATYTSGAVPSDGYLFVRLAETGITKFIYVDELIMREVPVNAIDLGDPSGSDLDVSLVSLRVSRVLNAAGWPVADRAIDTGVALLAAKTVEPSSGSKALSELQDASDAELGVFFCDGSGKATFHDRLRRFNPVSVATFTDSTVGPGVFPFREGGLVTSYDKTLIANDVRVSPAVGEIQIVSDSASQTKYLQRTSSRSLSLADESQAHDLAEGILMRTKDPHLRFERLSLAPVAHEPKQPGLLNAVLAREVSDAVTVRFTPPGGGAQVSKLVHIEKASFSLEKPAFLNAQWQLSPADPASYWTVEDPVRGALDQNAVAF